MERVMADFFSALGRGDSVMLDGLLEDDFLLFEHGRWTRDTLVAFMPGVLGQEWTLQRFSTRVEGTAAFTNYENTANFIVDGRPSPRRWLESAVFLKREGRWRIAFMHSTRM